MTEAAYLEFLDKDRRSLITVLTNTYFTFKSIDEFKFCEQKSIKKRSVKRKMYLKIALTKQFYKHISVNGSLLMKLRKYNSVNGNP